MTTARDKAVAARDAQLQVFRLLSPSKRMSIACQMSDEARRLTADGIRYRHPDMTDDEVDDAVRRVLLHAP